MKKVFFLLFILLGTCGLAAGPLSASEASQEGESGESNETLDSLLIHSQPYLGNISAYKPIYFLFGIDPEKSRFQLSLKYQMFGDSSPLAATAPWATGIHLAYTQASTWDLKSDSLPFEDTSYMPEVFFRTQNVSHRPQWIDALFYQAGVVHESNGRDGDDSRNTNYFYFNPRAIFYGSNGRLGYGISPKLVCFFNSSNSNPGIENYRGYFELELKAGSGDGIIFGSALRFAPKGTSLQLDMTYPLTKHFFKNLEIYLHAQYVDVLAETLLNYRDRTEAFRLGFSIVR